MAEKLDQFSKKVSSIVESTKSKAKEIYDITKLKIELRKRESALDECFERLGRAYFYHISNNNDNSDKIEKLLAKAQGLNDDICNFKNIIAEAQNKKICEHCGSLYDAEQNYCQNCGQKVVAKAKEDKEENNIEIFDEE